MLPPFSSLVGHLRVGHQPGGDEGSWAITTCQRHLEVAIDSETGAAAEPASSSLRGRDAYLHLLEVITGLQSAVVAETNVSGQVRASWDQFRAGVADAPQSAARRATLTALQPVVAALFADAALVRQRWLQGLGGSSYGTLARKLLSPSRNERVLVIGAGDLARSVIPAFSAHDLRNYTRQANPPIAEAAQWADSVIFCTPPNAEFESKWWPHWGDDVRDGRPLQVLHLGGRAQELEHWPASIARRTLDDLLALSVSQSALRSDRIASALAHCAQLADERSAVASPALRYYPRT